MSIIAPNGNPEKYLEAHEKIIEALADGDAARAGYLTRSHVTESKETVIAFLKTFPQF
jgi:DNA-binding FadR family transcriptional regulator